MATEPRPMPGPFSGLSVKLIATIIAVILAVEIFVYFPSIAGFRANWLDDRLRVGVVAARVLDAVPDVMALPRSLTDRLLNSAQAFAIVYRREGQSQLIELDNVTMPHAVVTADMRQRDMPTLILGAIDTMINGGDRVLRIVGQGDGSEAGMVEVLMPEAPLRGEMLASSANILATSLLIALSTAIILYVFVSLVFIRPIRRLTANMVAYRQAPENASLIIVPEKRRDEIGLAEQELAGMQADIFTMLRQRRHLADLGMAVAKINHDLRNTLTSAQMLSDQVVALDDPKLQRLAPRLVTTLDRAIRFAQSVIDYGRQSTAPPRPVPVDLHQLINEAAFDAGLIAHPDIAFSNGVPEGERVSVDFDQMGRIFLNLLKNAREALEAAGGKIEHPAVAVDFALTPDNLVVSVSDNGPGLPPRARENLFVAFEGSARAGGTGLGLAISRELAEAHGGALRFVEVPRGTHFDVVLPLSLRLPPARTEPRQGQLAS